MKQYDSVNIRNVALAGHSGAGKTSLAEAILFVRKATDRLGNVTAGTTAADYDSQEIKRTHSINAALLPVDYKETKINLMDLPGRRDFVGEIKNCIGVADGVVLVVNGATGLEVGAEFCWEYADEAGVKARAVFVNMLDKDQGDFEKAFAEINDAFPARAVAVALPVGKADGFKGVVDLLKMKFVEEEGGKVGYADIPAEVAEAAAEARAKLVEAAAEGDEELMMKFLEDEELTEEEIISGLKATILDGSVLPVCCGSAIAQKGLATLLDLITLGFPNPLEGPGLEASVEGSEESERLKIDPAAQTLLYVFRTVSDQFSGHLNFFKVVHGKAESEKSLTNLTRDKSQRLAHILTILGKKHENIDFLAAGDLGAVAKLDATHTGDTLGADSDGKFKIKPAPMPRPTVRMAIEAKAKADEEKVGIGFRRLLDQDPTLHLARDPEIHQTILTGMGETHLQVAVAHLEEMSKVAVNLSTPNVPYRETITRKAEGQGKFKKQSGGRGQYGDCWVRLEPISEGEAFEFDWAIVGGAIPTKFQPSVEKGLIEALEKGVLSGHPTLGVKATCYDGSFHAVDSSEMAFKVAASMAFKNVAPKAAPVIMEPIYKLKIVAPESYMGDIMGDINSRRGRIIGTNSDGKKVTVEAQVPLSEAFTYGRELRSMTRGSGVFEMVFDRYERVPGDVQEKIIAESKNEKADE